MKEKHIQSHTEWTCFDRIRFGDKWNVKWICSPLAKASYCLAISTTNDDNECVLVCTCMCLANLYQFLSLNDLLFHSCQPSSLHFTVFQLYPSVLAVNNKKKNLSEEGGIELINYFICMVKSQCMTIWLWSYIFDSMIAFAYSSLL